MLGSVLDRSINDDEDEIADIPARIRQIDGGYRKMMAKKNKHALSQHMDSGMASIHRASITSSMNTIDY